MTTGEKVGTKELVRRALDNLPDDATLLDVIDRLRVLHMIQRGLDDIDGGRVVTHEQAKRRLAPWLE